MQVAHIKLEKLTGLKGDIEGDFYASPYGIDQSIPIIYRGQEYGSFLFTQDTDYFYLDPVEPSFLENYKEHFEYGVNFLIKEWSYGSGVGGSVSKNPN